jgi:hypothetical protein
MLLIACPVKNEENKEMEPADEIQESIYAGVVGFNRDLYVKGLSNYLTEMEKFIENLNSKEPAGSSTALCYAVSKGADLFNERNLPVFDKIFLVSFTDGIDNYSSTSWLNEGVDVVQSLVYDKARSVLLAQPDLKSYTVGMGNLLNGPDMQKLVANGGTYELANTVNDLRPVFREIANNVISSAKNFTILTNRTTTTEEYPKYFKLTVSAMEGHYNVSDIIECKLVGVTFSIVTEGNYTTFSTPVQATIDSGNNAKYRIPLNNLKFTKSGQDLIISDIDVQIKSTEEHGWYGDMEDSKAEQDIAKKIGVVLVLDCSSSLGSAFKTVKLSAIEFINILDGSRK